MNIAELKLQFAESAALRILRADNGPLVLAVLFLAFKREHSGSVPESRLRGILEAELQELRDNGEAVSSKGAREYLIQWSDQEHGYLRRRQGEIEDEAVYELTPDIEIVFQWLDSLRPKSHVGTESKFKHLAATLKEIIDNSNAAPDARIALLRPEQARLEEEIKEIERTGKVQTYTPTQINERFAAVLETARKLLGDFREVERHFRKVTEAIAVRQTTAGSTRGAIVGETLNAQEELRSSSQGQSFYAFWEFLLAPVRRREFTELVELAYGLTGLDEELRADFLLRRLQTLLRAEGNKVVASNERLIAQLRRVLDVRASAERREVGRIIQEVKSVAHKTREMSPQTEILEIDLRMSFSSVMSKAPWSPPSTVRFGGDFTVSDGGDYKEALAAFLKLHPIDFQRLRKNIQDCLRTRVQIGLPELLMLSPPRNGILEVLAYVLIAESDGPHVVFEAFDTIQLPNELGRRFRVPQIVFSNR